MEISRSSPQGNILYILGVFKNLRRDLKNEGIDVKDYDNLLEKYQEMEYEKILEKIEEITNGVMTFID